MKKRTLKALAATALVGVSTIALASCGNTALPTGTSTETGTVAPTTSGVTPTQSTDAYSQTVDDNEGKVDFNSDFTPTKEGGKDFGTLKTSEFTSKAEDKEIIFYHTMGDKLQKVLQTAIDKFQAAYPDWKITHSQVGGYDEVKSQCIADLSAGSQPDLAYCYADHVAQYIKTGKVLNMNKFINAKGTLNGENIGYDYETEVKDFVTGYYREGVASNFGDYKKYGYKDDDMLVLPYSKSTEVMYYNVDALIDCGIVDADGNAKVPTTWDELWEDCEIIADKYPACTPLGYDSEANWIINMCKQSGWGYTSASDPYYLFNTTELANWLDQIYDYYDEGYITTQNEYGSYTSGLFVKGPAAGGTVFSIGSSGGASNQSSDTFTWDVAPIPGVRRADGTINNQVISQGPSLVMFQSESENADEKALMTWEFVKMLEDPTYQASFSMVSGYNPSRKSTAEIPAYKAFLSKEDSIISVTANVASSITDRFFVSPAFGGSSNAREQMQSVLLYVMAGTKDGTTALADAYKSCGGK